MHRSSFVKTATFALALTLTVGGQMAAAQSFNIDIGQPSAGPADTYAAAGQAGHWISIPATQGVPYPGLVDVDGNATAVRLSQIGGSATLLTDDVALTGEDAVLMNDFLITHTTVENCLFLSDMIPGEYEVLIYARMPAQPAVIANTDVDQAPGNPQVLVGGVWPGQHQEGISYSRHMAIVASTGASAGKLGIHAGVAPGGSFGIGAAMNGVQIRRIVPNPSDLDDSGTVDVFDLLALLGNWGSDGPGASIATPNDVVDLFDLLGLLGNWG